MWDWAKIGLLVLGLLKWVADRISAKEAEDLGRMKAEEEGREHVKVFTDRIGDVDVSGVSDDEVIRRDPADPSP
jgi:hypothetical protein